MNVSYNADVLFLNAIAWIKPGGKRLCSPKGSFKINSGEGKGEGVGEGEGNK